MSETDFDMVLVDDKMELVITDCVVLNKKEKAPPKYVVVDPAINEGGRLSFGKRYIAYTREVPNRLGRVAVTDVKIVNTGDRPPVGYRSLSETMDDNVKSFSAKVIIVKLEPLESAKEAVTDIIVLSGSKKDQVPSGYKRLPEVNGFSICFQTQKVEAKSPPSTSSMATVSQKNTASVSSQPLSSSNQVSPKKPKSAIDGLIFELSDSRGVDGYLQQFSLPDLQILSFDEIDNKFNVDWQIAEEHVLG